MRVKAPSGTGWPSQARIEVRVLDGRNVNNSSYAYGLEPTRIFTKDTYMTALMTDRKMRLVSVGACGICTE